MAIPGSGMNVSGWDSEVRTAGMMPVFGRQAVENRSETIKGPSFSDHVNAAAYRPDDWSEPVARLGQNPAKSAGNAAGSASGSGPAPFSFWDLIDVINPLQHIPVVSTIYRHLTGDEIRDSARLVGDALYGGPVGAAAGLVDIAFKNATGKDAGETVMAMLGSDKMERGNGVSDPGATVLAASSARDMNDIHPAGGSTVRMADIVWDAPAPAASLDVNRFLPPGTPTEPEHSPAEEASGTATHTQDKDGRFLKSGTTFASSGPTAPRGLDSPSFPIMLQETPAVAEEHGLPPALIADKMMRALDAYGAMKRQGL